MKHCKQTFTLIELLVVICIIAILASMLLPALQSARESASSATCLSNLGQFSKGVQMYATNYGDYIPALTTTSSSGWEEALVTALGQDISDTNVSIRKSFFCDADANENGSDAKKSYSLNCLKDAVHPYIDSTLGPKGSTSGLTVSEGYISGNKTTAIYTPSDLIIIGENASAGNTFSSAISWQGKASFTVGDDMSGTASPIQQQAAIYSRLSSHATAGNLFLDGHAKHIKPQQTLPTKDGLTVSKKSTVSQMKNAATDGAGSWTDCTQRKEKGYSGSCDGTCHKK